MSLKHTDITVVTTNYIQDQVMGAELPIKDAVKAKYGEAASRVASGLEVQACRSRGDRDPLTGTLCASNAAPAGSATTIVTSGRATLMTSPAPVMVPPVP